MKPGTPALPKVALADAQVAMGSAPSQCEFDVNFGQLRVGEIASQDLTLTDIGEVSLNLQSLTPPSNLAYGLNLTVPQVIPTGGTVTFTISFEPLVAGTANSTLLLATDSLACPTVTIGLQGSSIQVDFTATPYPLDFGNVLISTTKTLPLTLTNHSSAAVTVDSTMLQGQGAQYFTLKGLPSASGSLAPGSQTTVQVTYTPTTPGVRDYGNLLMQIGQVTVAAPLLGHPIAEGVAFSPSPVDFGYLIPGTCATQSLTLTNIVNVPIEITSDTDPFAQATPYTLGAISPPLPLSLKPGDQASVPITFCPTAVVGTPGAIGFDTSNPNDGNPMVALSGFGGGPQVSCSPTNLDFGEVPVGLSRQLKLTCTNTGSLTTDNAVLAIKGLLLKVPGFSAQLDPSTPDDKQIVPQGAVQFDVTFRPEVSGPANGTLDVLSNGGSGAPLSISLSGSSVELPPCQFAVAPLGPLNFGNVADGQTSTLSLGISNTGTNDCLISNVGLGQNLGGAFSLSNPPQQLTTLAAKSQLLVQINFTPPASGLYSGELDFTVSSQGEPNQVVLLTGTDFTACLSVVPANLDFGEVGESNSGAFCESRPKSFTVYNTCNEPLSLTSLALQQAPPDSMAQFSSPTGPPLPTLLSPGSSATFALDFYPTTLGDKTAQLLLPDPISGATLWVGLAGDAVSSPTATDTFTATAPKADLLIDFQDDSYYYTLPTAQLQTALQAFVTAASGIDWRIALTTDDVCKADGVAEWGRLIPCPGCNAAGSPALVADSQTMNGSSIDPVGALMKVIGTVANTRSLPGAATCYPSQFFESIRDALAIGPQPGVDFFRSDAELAVLTVSADTEPDYSTYSTGIPESLYQQDFQNSVATASDFSWSIVGPYSGYASLYLNTDMQTMIAQTGGHVFDSTLANWQTGLSFIIKGAVANQSYALSSTPSDSTQIKVYDQGTLVPQTDWNYLGSGNAIAFIPSAAPAVSDVVSVTYPINCR